MPTEHKHSPHIDSDGDTVCTTCHRVLKLGVLGLDGISPSGYNYGGRSALMRLKGQNGETTCVALSARTSLTSPTHGVERGVRLIDTALDFLFIPTCFIVMFLVSEFVLARRK